MYLGRQVVRRPASTLRPGAGARGRARTSTPWQIAPTRLPRAPDPGTSATPPPQHGHGTPGHTKPPPGQRNHHPPPPITAPPPRRGPATPTASGGVHNTTPRRPVQGETTCWHAEMSTSLRAYLYTKR